MRLDLRYLHWRCALTLVGVGAEKAVFLAPRHGGFFHVGVPFATCGALAEPLGRLITAVLAEKGGGFRFHCHN